jgi:hypothetical protein
MPLLGMGEVGQHLLWAEQPAAASTLPALPSVDGPTPQTARESDSGMAQSNHTGENMAPASAAALNAKTTDARK